MSIKDLEKRRQPPLAERLAETKNDHEVVELFRRWLLEKKTGISYRIGEAFTMQNRNDNESSKAIMKNLRNFSDNYFDTLFDYLDVYALSRIHDLQDEQVKGNDKNVKP